MLMALGMFVFQTRTVPYQELKRITHDVMPTSPALEIGRRISSLAPVRCSAPSITRRRKSEAPTIPGRGFAGAPLFIPGDRGESIASRDVSVTYQSLGSRGMRDWRAVL